MVALSVSLIPRRWLSCRRMYSLAWQLWNRPPVPVCLRTVTSFELADVGGGVCGVVVSTPPKGMGPAGTPVKPTTSTTTPQTGASVTTPLTGASAMTSPGGLRFFEAREWRSWSTAEWPPHTLTAVGQVQTVDVGVTLLPWITAQLLARQSQFALVMMCTAWCVATGVGADVPIPRFR